VIISTEQNRVVSERSKKLKIRCIQGCDDKRSSLEEFAKDRGISMDQVAYVGNDINDLDCLKIVALPIVVQDAFPSLLSIAKYRTDTKGGYGAVREVCELFAQILGSETQQ